MSDDSVRLHVEVSVVSFSSLVFLLLWKFCTEDVSYRITMKTRILGAQV